MGVYKMENGRRLREYRRGKLKREEKQDERSTVHKPLLQQAGENMGNLTRINGCTWFSENSEWFPNQEERFDKLVGKWAENNTGSEGKFDKYEGV